MKALILTSNSSRHKYFASKISENFNVVGIVSEPKKDYYTKAKYESEIVRNHFDNLKSNEEDFFKINEFPKDIDLLELEKSRINDLDVISWAKSKSPDIVFLFGTAILKEDWLNLFKDRIINLHLGLSPYYRGSATLFWPIHNNELQYVGVTIHLATKKVDAGKIIARVRPSLSIGDDYYKINNKAIKEGIDQMSFCVKEYLSDSLELISQDLSISKLYKKSDFNEDTLVQALNNINGGLSNKMIETINKGF